MKGIHHLLDKKRKPRDIQPKKVTNSLEQQRLDLGIKK